MAKAESSNGNLIFACIRREVSLAKRLLKELNFNPIATVIGLTITLNFCWLSWSPLVNAEEAPLTNNKSRVERPQKKKRTLQKRSGFPVHRIGGGSRGNCLAPEGELVALVPKHSVGLTSSTSPQLFFSIPKTQKTHLLELVVRNQQDELIYDTVIATTERSGIIALQLPEHLASESLQSNKNYHWYLSLICNQQNRAHDLVVSGWLRRIELEPNLRQQLQNSAPLEQAHLYQQQGLWHDALSAVVQAQKTASDRREALAKWTELLTALGLGELAERTLIGEWRLQSNSALPTMTIDSFLP